MRSKKPTNFRPYSNFNSELLRIDEFEELSTIAYGITLQLLFHRSKKELIEIKYPESEWDKSSFSMADQEIEDIVLSCEWITLNDYATRIGSSLDEIRYKASQNQLGPIKEHPETKEKVVIWPPEYQTKALEDLPTPDLKLFTAKVSIKSSIPMELDLEDVEQFDEIQKTFLRLAHSLGSLRKLTIERVQFFIESVFYYIG